MYSFSQLSLNRMSGIDERLIRIAKRAIQITRIDFGIPEYGGLRSTEDQALLYRRGVSKADGINKQSKHQSGKAIDFYAYVDNKASWSELHLALVANAFLQAASELGIKVRWGGLFKGFKDYPHIELIEEF